jgi:hypothetical protein
VKHLLRNAFALLVCAAFCLGIGDGCQSDGHGRSHNDEFTDDGLLTANAADLPGTLVTAHLDTPLPAGKNVLWCGSFQLAWNEACTLAGGKLQFRGAQPELAASLNRQTFDSADVDAASYVALAGYVREDIAHRIATQLKHKFGGHADPGLPTSFPGQRPQDMVVYAYLFKNLEFPVPYERGESPASFGKESVKCFGMGPDNKSGRAKMAAQTLIHDYVSADDFVIEIQTKSPDDRLILAKVAPGKTLAQTVTAVQRRADLRSQSALASDVLVIPKTNFDITRNYTELLGQRLQPTTPAMADDLTLLTAAQNTRFQMDEKGVRLKSEAVMHYGCSSSMQVPQHVMIFDKPFLIMMSRKKARQPYFALWVANPELLVHAK